MTTLKTIVEHREILNFQGESLSKTAIRRKLKSTKFEHIVHNGTACVIFVNHIVVGMYNIQLGLSENKGLRNFGVEIKDNPNLYFPINLAKDHRFRNQDWVSLSQQRSLNTTDLVNIIYYCSKLNRLKAFL